MRKTRILICTLLALCLLPLVPRQTGVHAQGTPGVAYDAESATKTSFGDNGEMVSNARVSQASAYSSGTTGYGGNQPQIYTALAMSLSHTGRQYFLTGLGYGTLRFVDTVQTTITITDSSGKGLQSVPTTMYDSPHDVQVLPDWLNTLAEIYNVLHIDYPTDAPTAYTNPAIYNGYTVGSAPTYPITARWSLNTPDNIIRPTFLLQNDKAIELYLQPTFPKPDVYTFSITEYVETGTCDYQPVGEHFDSEHNLVIDDEYLCVMEDSRTQSFSFQYVYENEAGQDGDTGDTFSLARQVSHGTYGGVLYRPNPNDAGADIMDYYNFNTNPNEKIAFSVTPNPGADFGLTVYDSNQNSIGTVDRGAGQTNALSFTASSSGGIYYAKIYITSGTGIYSFSLTDSFAMSAIPSNLNLGIVGTASTVTSTLTISSPTDFSGQVTLSTSVSPAVPNPPTVTISTVPVIATTTVNPIGVLSSGGCWAPTNPQNAFISDLHYATFDGCNGAGASRAVYDYGAPTLPQGSSITKVEILETHYEGSCRSACSLQVSWGEGSLDHNAFPSQSASVVTDTQDITSLNSAWTSSSIQNLQVAYTAWGGVVDLYSYLDWIPLRITYTYPVTTSTLSPGSVDSRTVTMSDTSTTPAGNYVVSITGTGGGISFTVPITVTVQDFQLAIASTLWVTSTVQVSPNVVEQTWWNPSNPSYAFSPDGSYAAFDTANGGGATTVGAVYGGYYLGPLPSGSVITGVKIQAKHYETGGDYGGDQMWISAGGQTGSYNHVAYSSSDTTVSFDVTTLMSSWTRDTINNAQVSIFDEGGVNNHQVSYLDWIPIQVTYQYPVANALLGQTASAPVSISGLYGFAGSVLLTANAPGLSCSFNPSSVSLDSTTLSQVSTLTCTGSTGSYPVTITASSGSASHTVAMTINIQDFTISLNPTSQTVLAGTLGNYTISLSSLYGFSGLVNLTYIVPPGLNCDPPFFMVVTDPSILQCTGNAGTYTVTVQAVSGPIVHNFSVTLTILAPYSFRDDFSYTSNTNMAAAGWTICGNTNQVNVGSGFLTLTNDGNTAGDDCWYNIPAGVTSWSVSTRGQYVSGASGYPNGGATWIWVTTPAHQYQWDLDGYYSSYYLFRDGVNVKTVPGFTPQIGAWHDLTLEMRNGVLTGIVDGKVIASYTEVSGTNTALTSVIMMPGWMTVSNYDWVTINQINPSIPADFAMGSSPVSTVAIPGTNAVMTINLSSLAGFSGTVNLTASVSPSTGLTCNLNPTTVTLTSSATSTLTCTGTAGTYQIALTGTRGAISHTTPITVYVQDFGVTANPTSLTLVAGLNGASTISLNQQFNGIVSLTISISPSTGLYCSFSQTSITGSGTSTMNCNGSIAGSYTVTVTGTYGTTSRTTQVTYNIRDFILTVTPTAISIPDGRSATLAVQATSMNGYTGTITLGETYTACATWNFAKPTLTLASGGSDSTILTLTMGPNCSATQYNTAVTGYDSVAGFSRSASLVVNATDFGVYSQIGFSSVGIGGQYTLKYNVTYSNNNNYPGSILTQTVSWGTNNCCLSTTVPTLFSSTKPDVNSAPGVLSNINVQAQSFSYPWNGQGFYAQGRDWLFFIYYGTCSGTTTNCLYYATSTNGATWSIYNTGLVTGSMPSVVTNGTAVFYVRYDGTDGQSGKALKLGIGVLHTDGTIAWQTEKTVKAATSGIFWYASSMRISTTGQIFVAYNRVTSAYGSGLPYVIHSNGLDYTTWQQETLLINSNDDWRFSLVPLPNGQMYILYWPFWGGLNGRAWSSGSWGNQETVTPNNTYVQQTAFGFSTGNSTVYAIWQERTSQKIQFAIRNNSWGTPQTIFTADTNSNPRWSTSYDSLHRTWYILYYSYTTNQIWEYSGEPGAWSGRTVLYSTIGATSSMYIGSFYKSGQVNTSSNSLGIFWTQTDASSNLQLKYANATIYTGGSFSATWPITSTGSGSGATSLMITASDGTITRSLTIQLVVNGYNVTYFYNPLAVTRGSSSGIYLQIFSEYNIPLTSATIVPVTVPSCLTVSPPNPQYFNIGPIGGYDFPLLPIAASSSCALGNYQVTVAISGVSVHTYDKQLTFTVTVVAPPPGGGGGGGGSVAAGTLITLADGSQVPVQSLQVGMKLLSYDMTTHQYVVTTITKFVTVECYNQMIISTGTGKPLIVDQNPAQKLYVQLPDGTVTLMGATDLKVGYLLFDALSQTWVPITSIHYQNGGQHLMFDIYTDGPGNYIANGYLDPLKT